MERKIKTYTDEFRLQIVKLIETGKSMSEVLKEYNLPQGTVYGWIKKYNNSGSFRDKYNLTEEQRELSKLNKELKQLRMENDILKQVGLIMGRK